MADKTCNVLLNLTGNSAGSIMAEVVMNELGHGHFEDSSDDGHPYGGGYPLTAHWGPPDPAADSGSDEQKCQAFETADETHQRRIDRFTRLPLDSQDAAALPQQLQDIGHA